MRDLKLQSKVDSTITYYNIECFCVFMVRRKVEDGGVFGFYSSWGKGNFDMNTNSAQWAQKCQSCTPIFFTQKLLKFLFHLAKAGLGGQVA